MVTKSLATLVLAVALTACAAGGTQQSDQPSSSHAASIEPTPTATPVDIPSEFAAQMLASSEFRADISGTLQVGDNAGEINGVMDVVASGSHQRVVISFPEMEPQETEEIVLADASYALEDGIWIRAETDPGSGGGDSGLESIFVAALAHPDRLVLAGTETIDGERLHRLEIRPAPEISAEMLGFADPSVTEFEATLAFVAEDDGTPAGLIIEANWLQGEEAMEGQMDMRFRLDEGTHDVQVIAPEDPWEVRVGVELGYRMAHPVDWAVSYRPENEEYFAIDDYLGPVDDEVHVVAYPDLQGATGTDEWFRWSAISLVQDFGTEPEIATEFALTDGSKVRVLTLHYMEGATKVFFQQAVIVRGTQAWDVDWYSLAGNEAEDEETLLQMLGTFEPAG